MPEATMTKEKSITREQLIELLNEDLAREYQAVIAYVVYSQVLKGAEYMNIAKELEKHAGEELQHALTVSKHIDYLGGMPTATPKPVKQSDKAEEMLRADLKNESDTIRAYRERVMQCESLGEYAIAEDIREILRQEQEHLIDLATALGEDPPNVSRR
jgi:bacterioferritin